MALFAERLEEEAKQLGAFVLPEVANMVLLFFLLDNQVFLSFAKEKQVKKCLFKSDRPTDLPLVFRFLLLPVAFVRFS
jgi:hypothetical protein